MFLGFMRSQLQPLTNATSFKMCFNSTAQLCPSHKAHSRIWSDTNGASHNLLHSSISNGLRHQSRLSVGGGRDELAWDLSVVTLVFAIPHKVCNNPFGGIISNAMRLVSTSLDLCDTVADDDVTFSSRPLIWKRVYVVLRDDWSQVEVKTVISSVSLSKLIELNDQGDTKRGLEWICAWAFFFFLNNLLLLHCRENEERSGDPLVC